MAGPRDIAALPPEKLRSRCDPDRFRFRTTDEIEVSDSAPEMVDDHMRGVLAPVPVSLSKKLSEGVNTFLAMGMELAYAGDPKAATVEEGELMIQRLAEMVVGEVREAFGLPV